MNGRAVPAKVESIFKRIDEVEAELDQGTANMIALRGELLTLERATKLCIAKIRREMDAQDERRHRLSDFYYSLKGELNELLDAHVTQNTRATVDVKPKTKKETP